MNLSNCLTGLNKMYPFRIASNQHWDVLVAVQDWDSLAWM